MKLRKIKIIMSIINLNVFTEEISFKTAKQGILRGFPDLAGKIAEAGQLTKESNIQFILHSIQLI